MNNRYKLKITGKDPKRFITNLIKEKIYIYGIFYYQFHKPYVARDT